MALNQKQKEVDVEALGIDLKDKVLTATGKHQHTFRTRDVIECIDTRRVAEVTLVPNQHVRDEDGDWVYGVRWQDTQEVKYLKKDAVESLLGFQLKHRPTPGVRG